MPSFTSKREKHLWMWAGIALITIYSTLGIVQPVSSRLRDSGLLTPLFILALVLVIATMLYWGLNKMPKKSVLGIYLGILAVYLMVLVRIEIPEERTHIIEYSVVAALIYQAILERERNGAKVPYPALTAILVTGLAGTTDEFIQAIIPSRVFDMRDILFNFLAGLMAIGSSVALNWMQNRENQNQ